MGWVGVIPFPRLQNLTVFVEITLSKELCFIKGMALFAVNLDLNFD